MLSIATPGPYCPEPAPQATRSRAGRSRQWAFARRPGGTLESTRWLFVALVLLSLLLTVPAPLAGADGAGILIVLTSSAALAASWVVGYLRHRASLAMDLVDTVAVFAFAVACDAPGAVFGILFAALWFRSLYGSGWRAVLRSFLFSCALVAAVTTWPLVFGRTGEPDAVSVLAVIPIMFLTVIVSRQLATSLVAREYAQEITAVHAAVGSELLGVTDEWAIREIARRADDRICAATPGLRLLRVVRHGTALRVSWASGPWANVPATIPSAVIGDVGDAVGSTVHPASASAELEAAAGTSCPWVCVPLPDVEGQQVDSWVLLSSPGRVSPEVLTAVGIRANHVALALRNSQVHRELITQAAFDGLTGLANRTTFNEALVAALEDDAGSDTSVLFIDLDDFKDINDRFGHRAGDETLHEVAARLRRATRPGDLCARLGGDEFGVLLRATQATAAAEVAERVVAVVAASMPLDGGIVRVGASVGAATASAHSDPELLLHRADAAMYAAKARRVEGRARDLSGPPPAWSGSRPTEPAVP